MRSAADFLPHLDRSAAQAGDARLDKKFIIHERGLEKFDGHGAHGEMEAAFSAARKKRPVFDAQGAQKLGAASLKKPQIGRVIHAAGKIGVFIIDAHGYSLRRGKVSCLRLRRLSKRCSDHGRAVQQEICHKLRVRYRASRSQPRRSGQAGKRGFCHTAQTKAIC